MSWSIISAQDLAPQAWRNGGGWTRELLAWPHPEDWVVRVSVADIEADGPFSAFPGVDRWFAVLQGGGVRLFEGHDSGGVNKARELRCADPLFPFDGGQAPACQLLDGMTRDFNLMYRRGHGLMRVQPASQPLLISTLQPPKFLALFTAEGGQLSHGGRAMTLQAMSLAWCESPAAQRCEFKAPVAGAAWWLELTPPEEASA